MEQISLRLPADLARALTQRARARGIKRSALVREALEAYLRPAGVAPMASMVRERAAPYLGSLELSQEHMASDPISALIRERNWRE